jgi:NADPH-dependent glutamate synthase beta subunit-like oxidoreductase
MLRRRRFMRDGGRVTEVAVSSTTTLVTKTGSWKYIRPIYQDRVAPCNEACPVGIDIEGYLNLVREDRLDDACDLLVRENPMPAITGRVCHHPCEIACNRRPFDEAVAVHAIERALGDRLLERPVRRPARTSGASVGIVGSGPAGLACAYHAARLGYAVTVFEAAPEPGGMLRAGIPEYRLPRAVLDLQIAWLRAHGITIECGVRVGTDLPWWSMLGSFDAVFLAFGAQQSKALGVPGEKLVGVESGLDFLKKVNAGARPPLGQRAVVVGGGNTAMDCARTALRLGADATVLYRRTRAEMPAIADEVDEAEREGVKFVFLAAPIRLASSNGRVTGIECQRMELGPPDASGRRAPVPVEGARFPLAADTVLSAIGEMVDLESLPGELERIPSGLLTGEYGETTRAAVFAGGDMVQQPRTVADALGAGKRAAIGIDQYLRMITGRPLEGPGTAELRYGSLGNLSVTRWRGDDPVRRTSPVNQVVRHEDLNIRHFVHAPRRGDGRLGLAESRQAFREVNLGLSPDAALDEALRCLNCGVCNRCDLCLVFCPDAAISHADGGYAVATEYCKGCGICAEECPRGAIVMTREGL